VKLPRRVTHCLLGAVITVALLFRYPLGIGHEMGSDTTFIHTLSNSIVQQGYAAWILSPSSYFGLYALSYPSAEPFLLASMSLISDTPIEGAMLLNGLAFAVVGALAAFAAARRLTEDDRFAILVSLLFSVAPFYLKETTWIGSSRGFDTSLVPSVFLVLLLNNRKFDSRHVFITGLLIFTMSALHRMGTLTAFVLIAYAFAIPFHKVTQKLRFVLGRYEKPFRLISSGTAAAAFLGLFYIQFLFPGIAGPNVVEEYGTSAVLTGHSFPVLLLNMAVSLAGKTGVLLPLAVMGLAGLVWKRPKTDRDKFLLVTAFVIVPLLSLRDYIGEFLIFIFVLFLAMPLIPKRDHGIRRKLVTVAAVVLMLGGAIAFSWTMKDYWRERYNTDSPIPDDVYDVALYTRWHTSNNMASNEGMSAGRVAAISGRPVLPLGGASNHWFGPQQLTFGFVNSDRVAVRLIPLTSITFQTDEIFLPVGVPNAKDGYEAIFYNKYGDSLSGRALSDYDISYVLVTNLRPNEFQSYIWRPSPFLVGVQQEAFRVYDAGSNSIWYLG